MGDITLGLNDRARDVLLMHLFLEVRTLTSQLAYILSGLSGKTRTESDAILLKMRNEELVNALHILSRFGELDVPGWRQALGLSESPDSPPSP
jgi:hypothetical protein